QELIAYIRGEVNKGKTREEIRASLLSGGGWSEADISEAFRTVMPLESVPVVPPGTPVVTTTIKPFIINPTIAPAPAPSRAYAYSGRKPSHMKGIMIWGLLAILIGAGGYYFRPQLGDMWNTMEEGWSGMAWFSSGEENEEDMAYVPPPIEEPKILLPTSSRYCGETKAPELNKQTGIEEDAVLGCIGASALACEWAQATLISPLFPTIIEIIPSRTPGSGNCSFSLSYASDSTLSSLDGKSMAGESIACPLQVVKSFKEGVNNTLVFSAPTKESPRKYGAEIFFYGTTGVFLENNFSQSGIEESGCSGGFIGRVIDSNNLMKSN
ncbi:MAG: hypothetical protein WD991_00455, partial [Candidatus Paceibacterota bacterium]